MSSWFVRRIDAGWLIWITSALRHNTPREVERMPYIINNYRIPKPGQYTNVVRGVAESLKAIGRAGFVNVPISPPMPNAQGMGVVSTLAGLDTLDDVDALFDSMLADDMAALAARDELSAMCERANLSVSRVLSPPWTPPEGFEAKIISRNIVVAIPGKARELLELLLEWGEELDFRGAGVVSVSLGGQLGAIRVSHIVESLQALEDLNGQIGASPRVQKLVELTNGPAVRAVGRITYINQP